MIGKARRSYLSILPGDLLLVLVEPAEDDVRAA